MGIENIESNKKEFIELLKEVESLREGSDIDGLIAWLEEHGFFVSPATTQYHHSEEGGLCKHSLEVYHNLLSLYEKFSLSIVNKDTLIILGLLHDIIRCTIYEPSVVNVKTYCENGKNVDNLGRFIWEAKKVFKVKKDDTRVSYGNYNFDNYYTVATFIPLTDSETSALISQANSNTDRESEQFIALKDRNVLFLQIADLLSSYLTNESTDLKNELPF